MSARPLSKSVSASKKGARSRKRMTEARNTPPSMRDLASKIETLARDHPCWSQVHEVVLNCTNHLLAMARCAEYSEKEAEGRRASRQSQ